MSEIKVNSIKGVAASVAALSINNTDGTCTANITNRSNRNIIINGAMQVAQRGTTSTTQNAYTTVDRWKILSGGLDEGVTTAQSDITSGLAYNDGFRKAYKVQNGNQTSGAGTSDYLVPVYKIEAQDLANSGWDYVSSSSFITISFYVKSSVAQTFQVQLYNGEPSQKKQYVFEYSATTSWTRITHTVSGASGVEVANDNGGGFDLYFNLFHGTDSTDNSYVNNQWNNYGGGNPQYKDNTSTWYTTNDATWEITGLQVEVGSVATDFEHRSFAHELFLCQRYYEVLVSGQGKTWGGAVVMYLQNETHHQCNWVEKRTSPSLEFVEGTNYYQFYGNGSGINSDRPHALLYANTKAGGIQTTAARLSGNLLQGGAAFSFADNANAFIAVDAEL